MSGAQRRAHIALVLAGGTIGTFASQSLDYTSYHESGTRRSASDLLAALPEASQFAEVEPVDFRRISSTALTVDDWLDLRRLVQSLISRVDGVVIAHGTNTLEETAYFLDLTLTVDKPVVFVGSIRPWSTLSSDAPLNLLRSIQVAASPDAKGQGVLLSIDERIFLARDVVKAASQGPGAFRAPISGPVGFVGIDGRIVMTRLHTRSNSEFDVSSVTDLPRVDIVISHIGADGLFIDTAVAGGAKGIVIAGAGAGRTTPLEDEAMRRAAEEGVIVCLSSRIESGFVVPTPASTGAGFVAGRDLAPWKARLLLSLALTTTEDPKAIQNMFDRA